MAYQSNTIKPFFAPTSKIDVWLAEYEKNDPQFYAQNKLIRKLELVRVCADGVHKQIKDLPSAPVEVEEGAGLIKEILDKIDDELHDYFSKQYLEMFHA